ncbi:MAG: cellulase family glycosylhydrolase [Verrucomicrobia bacterium]|nr:cellulase family glycosylhydrolase [Verrucomicrobiota bacterium]
MSQADSYVNQHLETHHTAKDAALIKAMGFRHVRFAFNDATVVESENPALLSSAKMPRFDAAIDLLLAAGLAVIVDFHPEDAYKRAVEKDDVAAGDAQQKRREAEIHGRNHEIPGLPTQRDDLAAQSAAACQPKPHHFVIKPAGQ